MQLLRPDLTGMKSSLRPHYLHVPFSTFGLMNNVGLDVVYNIEMVYYN
jgi:hypothetical protein